MKIVGHNKKGCTLELTIEEIELFSSAMGKEIKGRNKMWATSNTDNPDVVAYHLTNKILSQEMKKKINELKCIQRNYK